MNKYKWTRIREVEKMEETTFRKDDVFLYGNHVIAQKDAKKVGDQITYYKVIKAENNGKDIEYVQIFDVLEEDVIDDKRN